MLQLHIIEVLGRALPEALIYMLAIYVFNHKKLQLKPYLINVMVGVMSIYFVRLLPITFGIHTILIMSIFIIQAMTIYKINIKEAIRSLTITFILQFLAEGINLTLIEKVVGRNIEEVLASPQDKIIYGMPSLVLMIVAVLTYSYISKKRRNTMR